LHSISGVTLVSEVRSNLAGPSFSSCNVKSCTMLGPAVTALMVHRWVMGSDDARVAKG